MKRIVLTSIIAALLCAGCVDDRSGELADLQEQVGGMEVRLASPPPSVDAWYPPYSREPVLLVKMYALGTALTGTALNFFEGDSANASGQFGRFKTAYSEAATLVPEWQEAYPTAPVDALERALQTANPAEVSDALMTLGHVCHNCHLQNMVEVYQAYHWGDFSELTVSDPVTGENAVFSEFMHRVEQPFVGIGISIEEGQTENAKKYFDAFNSRFQALKLVCDECHETDREYFVDNEVQQTIDDLGRHLNATPPDPRRAGNLLAEIGQESCRKCHLVHVPAAYAKATRKGTRSQSPE